MSVGQKYGIRNAGYYALRSLRIEKFFAFWGQDLDPFTTPLECGREFRVKFDKVCVHELSFFFFFKKPHLPTLDIMSCRVFLLLYFYVSLKRLDDPMTSTFLALLFQEGRKENGCFLSLQTQPGPVKPSQTLQFIFARKTAFNLLFMRDILLY